MQRPKSITNEEYETLIVHMDLQDCLITRTSKETGLRTSDVLRLRRNNLQIKNGKWRISVQERKTKKHKVSEISESLYTDLLHYYGARHNILTLNAYFFVLRHNPAYDVRYKPIERTTYYKRLKRYANESGIDVSPHSLRRLYAQNLWRETHNIFEVQKAMNHKYITTTATYLDINVNDLIQNALMTK